MKSLSIRERNTMREPAQGLAIYWRWMGLGLALFWMMGCREHPRVTSRESLDLIKQVYTACNTRNQERLAASRQKLDQLATAGQLSQPSKISFRRILSTAESGDWESAQRSSLQFARDRCVNTSSTVLR